MQSGEGERQTNVKRSKSRSGGGVGMPHHRNAQRRAGKARKKLEKRTKQSAFCKLGEKSIMGLVLGSKVAESLGPGKGAWDIGLVPAACRPDFGATPPPSAGSGGHQRRLYERRLGIRLDFGRSTPPPNYPSPPLPHFSTRKDKNKSPRVPKFLPKKCGSGIQGTHAEGGRLPVRITSGGPSVSQR